jgi:protein TonB
MPGHVDILDDQEAIWPMLVTSMLLHAALFGSIYGFNQAGERMNWGDPHALGGGSVGVQAVRQIPLPGRAGETNPLANDTQSRAPAPPKPQPKKAQTPPPDSIELRGRNAPQRPPRRQTAQDFRQRPERPNQVYSSTGQALASPMYGGMAGTMGRVGIGPRGSFGQRFGWYRDLLEQRVGQKWRTDDVDPRLQTAPPVIVTFDILRNGQVRSVRILQTSNNRALDYSALRAIGEAGPFPPLPPGFERDSAQIEFWFQLKR